MDWLQWSGSPPPDPTNWDTITYTYDPAGRRIKKNVDGSYMVKYVYAETHASNRRDSGHVIAEYDDSNLLRKYIYGARVDEPVCMIDVAANNAAYYYHFDGLGSVVALSDSDGDSCQSYEYSVYGQVAASDPNFLANPYMFTGRRFDIETGLYYYRARYYNPHIGRFMQTDPVGYGYGYCGNNPLSMVDPSGCHEMAYHHFHFTMPSELIDTTGLSLDEIPGEFSDWLLSDMSIDEQMPGWDVHSVTWVPDSDELLDVVIFYNGCYVTDPLPVAQPELSVMHAEVIADTTPNIFGEPTDPTVVDTVALLVVNDVVMIDKRTLNRIITPAIQEVSGWPPGAVGPPISMLINMVGHWDSWFWDRTEDFKYSADKQVYSGQAINYIVGGHAFRHYGFSYEEMMWCFYNWKKYIWHHEPDTPALGATKTWLFKGYNEYYLRKDW